MFVHKIICNRKQINCGVSNLSDKKQLQRFYKIHISATFFFLLPNYKQYLIDLTCIGKFFLTYQNFGQVSDDDK